MKIQISLINEQNDSMMSNATSDAAGDDKPGIQNCEKCKLEGKDIKAPYYCFQTEPCKGQRFYCKECEAHHPHSLKRIYIECDTLNFNWIDLDDKVQQFFNNTQTAIQQDLPILRLLDSKMNEEEKINKIYDLFNRLNILKQNIEKLKQAVNKLHSENQYHYLFEYENLYQIQQLEFSIVEKLKDYDRDQIWKDYQSCFLNQNCMIDFEGFSESNFRLFYIFTLKAKNMKISELQKEIVDLKCEIQYREIL